ncbi:Organic hydroperoxide resistance protein [uncultured Dysgonomonas sp.]|jgi:osmotically inducible protein OsmC|uniref:Organic hydroperoxide resistance protein n=2 Tax=Bacteroidota TaxID=976 RepID=A0A212JYA0_9BACT|nr:organic hydroperoxide resistance protein [Proteiniphilum sp.]MEA5128029.1 organic hydroperoxide resistance protein [Proteiniphilum sp.]SBW04235.1 Organic hydroperoxide resistance protein [uncultured Dysgonomonas sp.]
MMKKLYTANATATGGREGRTKSDDGVLDFKIEIPKEMGGKGGAYTNPEQLFAAGYAACFDSALNLVARNQKIKLKDTSVTASVNIGQNSEGGFSLAVDLAVSIPEIERETAQKLLETAHQVCPYSNATRGNIEVNLNLL